MNLGVFRIYLFLVLSAVLLMNAAPLDAEEEMYQEPDSINHRRLILPASNPLKGFDANLFAWHTANELLFMGGDWFERRFSLSDSEGGRFTYILMSSYFNWATSYYSHEVAHQFLNREHFTFWVDITDWFPYFVPEFVFSEGGYGFWDREELERYLEGELKQYTPRLVLVYVSGLYQQKFNAGFVAEKSSLKELTSLNNALGFTINGLSDFAYLLYGKDDPAVVIRQDGYYWDANNDINGYISTMKDIGILISSDDWLISSGFAFFASGQTWNSVRALYHCFTNGEKQVDNLTFQLGEDYKISPPNFYLFPTVRGLYLETECFVHSQAGSRTYRLSMGTGLDSFGLNQTGPVDWLRFGGSYYSYRIGIPNFPLSVSPFCYIDFDRSMRHRGQSLGFELRTPSWKRLSLYARLEHNRNDMKEQLIKNKEEGIYILTALEINL